MKLTSNSSDGYSTFVGFDGGHRILIGGGGRLLTQFGNNYFSTGRISSVNIWSHIVYTYNASTNKQSFYINGTHDGDNTPGGTPSWNGAFKVGQYDLVNYKMS